LAPGSGRAAHLATASAALRDCHHVLSWPPAYLRWRQSSWSPYRVTSSEA